MKTLSGALGHYSAGFTLNTYTHATAQMKQDAADTIGGVISQQMRFVPLFPPRFFCSWVTAWVNGRFPFAKAYQPSQHDLPPRKSGRPGFVPVCKMVLQSTCRRAILLS